VTGAATLKPRDVAQGQLDAYNAQDLDAFCAFYGDDIVVADFNGAVAQAGAVAFRERYAKMFGEFPENRVELAGRIVIGDRVIDHERVFRTPDATPFEVAVIYTIAQGKIVRADFVK
jgi:hypothetical protein